MSPMRYLLCLIGATAVANGRTDSYSRITRALPNIPCTVRCDGEIDFRKATISSFVANLPRGGSWEGDDNNYPDDRRYGYDDYDEPYGSQNQYNNDYYGDSRDDIYDDRGYDDRSPAVSSSEWTS